MTITLQARTPCVLCGCFLRVVMIATVRVNRRSMRTTAPMIGAVADHRCPECNWPNRSESAPRTRYVLDPGSAAEVAEYRMKRWGTGAGEVAVERAS